MHINQILLLFILHLYSFFLCIIFLFNQDAVAQYSDIVGITSSEEIRATHRVFDIYINRYESDSTALAYLTNFDESITITVLFGTWCHDSKKQVPAFIKTMDLAKNPKIQVTYIGVNRQKSDTEGAAKVYNLQYTPTFIIFRDENEIGRIVEKPTESIEKDLVEIFKFGVYKDI